MPAVGSPTVTMSSAATQPRVSELVAKLQNLAADRTQLDVAQFQFIGLEEVQKAYGARWPQKKAAIRDAAADFLRNRIDQQDVLVAGAEGFVIVFGAQEGDEAVVAAAELNHALNSFFLGDLREDPAPTSESVVSRLPAEDVIDTVVGSRSHYLSPTGDFPAEITSDMVSWAFQPVWNVRSEVIKAYYALPQLMATGARVPGYQFDDQRGRQPSLLELDLEALDRTEQALRTLIDAGKKTLVGASLHISTLSRGTSRGRVLNKLNEADHSLSKYRIIKLSAVPPGFPQMYLTEILHALRTRVDHIALSASDREADIDALLDLGLSALGMVLSPKELAAMTAEKQSELVDRIRRAAERAHAHKTMFFVEGPIASELAMRLSAVGVDDISSSAIWKPQAAPAPMMRWPASNLIGT